MLFDWLKILFLLFFPYVILKLSPCKIYKKTYAIANAINKLRLPVPICTEMTQSSDVQGNKIMIVKVKFILTFTIIHIQYSIIDMAHFIGLKVVAEGVETKEHLDFLTEHGCDYIQGYYFSKPLPEDEFEKMLDEQMEDSE